MLQPKLGSVMGGMGAYMHFFGLESQASLFGASAQYTVDRLRLSQAYSRRPPSAPTTTVLPSLAGGNIKNDYDDFWAPACRSRATMNCGFFALRYQYRIWGDWFVGAQALTTKL